MVKKEIVNVVATASINQRLDFEKLRDFKEISHNSNVYGGRVAYFKTEKMEGKVSIFNSGQMISVGTKSESKAFHELELAKKFLTKKRFVKPVEINPQTRNIVATADFETSVNLERLCENSKAIYEPEQFPAAILRLREPHHSSILIFTSGKVVITGLTSSSQIDPVVQQIRELIETNQ